VKDASEYEPVVRTLVGMNALVKDFNPPRDAEPSAGVLNLDEQEERLLDNEELLQKWEGKQRGSHADLVDEFGRVHVSSAHADEEEVAMPTVLTKLKKWADYASVGDPLEPTKFLPMKTPMSKEIIENWSLEHAPKHTLTIDELIESQERDHGRHVGLIIDLANHECLYLDDILSHNEKTTRILEYVHIQLVAKVLPPKSAVDQVERVAREFWSRKPDDYIAIHCAYGFNRTGFVLCSYLCQAHGMSVEEALETFAKARPPGVKHAKFVNELYARYGPSMVIQNSEALENEHSDVESLSHISTNDGQQGDKSLTQSPISKKMEDLVVSTPPSSSYTKSHPIGILAKSAPTSMRRTRSKCHVDEDSNDDEQFSRSYNSTGGIHYEELQSMASTLKFNDSIRKETSIGLAKALHDDFGQHDFHADELGDLQQSDKDDISDEVSSNVSKHWCTIS
jgi:protein-tyrosine phosphatase